MAATSVLLRIIPSLLPLTKIILSAAITIRIRKLTTGTEQLGAQSIVHQHDANNLRFLKVASIFLRKNYVTK